MSKTGPIEDVSKVLLQECEGAIARSWGAYLGLRTMRIYHHTSCPPVLYRPIVHESGSIAHVL